MRWIFILFFCSFIYASEKSVDIKKYLVEVRAYCINECCCGRWALIDPGKRETTYGGNPYEKGIAIPRRGPIKPNSLIRVKGYGLFKADDTGGWSTGKWKNKKELHVEVRFQEHQKALEWGVKKIEIEVLKKKEKKILKRRFFVDNSNNKNEKKNGDKMNTYKFQEDRLLHDLKRKIFIRLSFLKRSDGNLFRIRMTTIHDTFKKLYKGKWKKESAQQAQDFDFNKVVFAQSKFDEVIINQRERGCLDVESDSYNGEAKIEKEDGEIRFIKMSEDDNPIVVCKDNAFLDNFSVGDKYLYLGKDELGYWMVEDKFGERVTVRSDRFDLLLIGE